MPFLIYSISIIKMTGIPVPELFESWKGNGEIGYLLSTFSGYKSTFISLYAAICSNFVAGFP